MIVARQMLIWLPLVSTLLLGGCAVFGQDEDKVLIRDPGNRMYNSPVDVSETATIFWEYAVLSENVYLGQWEDQSDTPSMQPAGESGTTGPSESKCPKRPNPLPLEGWERWKKFPSPDLISEATEVGLYMEVWEKKSSPRVIAVVFRGTEASLLDWITNLRWFLRFVPLYKDQYTVVARKVGKEFVERLAKEKPEIRDEDNKKVTILATGHSLGGGLAQHFAYSLPGTASDGTELPRVSHVYAFDPSPVTGWYSIDDVEQRTINAEGLKIDRVFEHGEFLAYIRLAISYVYPPPDANPSVREVRYNFVKSANPFTSHSMRLMGCKLSEDAKRPEGSTAACAQ